MEVQQAATALRENRPDASLATILRRLELQKPSANALRIFMRACRVLGLVTFATKYFSGLCKSFPRNGDVTAASCQSHLANRSSVFSHCRARRRLRRRNAADRGLSGNSCLIAKLSWL